MADINVTNLTPETSLSLDGTEQFVMFDTAEGKRATVDAVGGYMIGRQLTQEEGTKTVSEKISEIEDEIETIAETDDTLSVEGKAADAKAAGDRLDVVEEGITGFQEGLDEVTAELSVTSRYAARAMADLAPLQTTLNMLSWIAAHGTMALTQDTEPVADHIYFVRDVNGIYVVGGTNYDVVANPVEDDIETYYELSIDESVTDYVKSHLNYVSGTGLYLDAGTGWKLLIASDGISVLHTENNADVLVSKLALTQQLGKLTGAHSVLDNDGQRFYASDGNTVLADLGYASGTNASGGTSTAPYYTLGLRSGGKGNYSVAEGVSQASGYASHAEGSDTTSSGTGSHAQNIGTVAGYEGQTAIGKYNDNDSGNALEIGNGTSGNSRSNAFEVNWDGTVKAKNRFLIPNLVTGEDGIALRYGTGNSPSSGLWSEQHQSWLARFSWDGNPYFYDQPMFIQSRTISLPSTFDAGNVYVRRYGPVVTVSITNVTKAAVGENLIHTLPEGWRPPGALIQIMVAPGSGTPANNSLSLRLQVNSEGKITVYNYRSTAITAATNQAGFITYIATQ